jgi:type VI secretion system Hcp family effector
MNTATLERIARKSVLVLLICCAATISDLSDSTASAATPTPDVYVCIDGIPGTGTAPYQNCIVASTFAVGVTTTVTPTESGYSVSKPTFQDVKITKQMDISSSYLAKDTASGEQLASVKIYLQQKKPMHPNQLIAPVEVDLEGALLTSVTQTVTEGTATSLVEVVTINFEKITWNVWPIKPDGSLGNVNAFCYDTTQLAGC